MSDSTIHKIMIPVGGAVIGAAVADNFRKPGSSGADVAAVGAGLGLLVGFGLTTLLFKKKDEETNG